MKWPKRLVVVRHGQSQQNVALDLDDILDERVKQQKEIRDADVLLTENGIWQAEQTGLFLAETEPFDVCFCSPYKRTLQTAKAIISNLGYDLRLFKDNRLREKEFGRLHGYTKQEIKDKFPEEAFNQERDGKYWYRLPGGENYPDVEMRIHSFLDKLNRDWTEKNVLVVTHQVPLKMFRALFEYADEESVLGYGEVYNCALEEFRINTSKRPEGKLELTYFNKVVYEQE